MRGLGFQEQYQTSSRSEWPACPKNGKSDTNCCGRGCRHNLHIGLPDQCDSFTASRLCCLEPCMFVKLFFKCVCNDGVNITHTYSLLLFHQYFSFSKVLTSFCGENSS